MSLVRLKWCLVGVVKVHFCALKKRAVSNRNCVVETQGGEQRDEKGQSVTTSSKNGGQRELDSVGGSGEPANARRSPNKIVRPALREWIASGREPQMVGDRMV